MCFSETPLRLGAYLPRGSAPPEPSKLWHAVPLVRKSWPPRAIAARCSSSERPSIDQSDSSGVAGPGPRDATYAARATISSWV
jgi:hypothetical protein